MYTRIAVISTALAAFATAKITPRLIREIENSGDVPETVIIEFSPIDSALEKADARIGSVQSRGEKIQTILESLEDHANREQVEAIEIVSQAAGNGELKSSFSAKTLSIANIMVLTNANKELIQRLATVSNVKAIRHQYYAHLPPIQEPQVLEAPTAAEWCVEKIAATSLWAKGVTGKGVVVGGIDTGVHYTHEALVKNWRSENGYYQPKGQSQWPIDNNSHGTHTMGTSVGQNGIGVAPDAKWIACEGCLPDGSCPESVTVACAQYMLCPHDYQGKNPKCELAPHVINNSWGDDDEIPDVPYYKGPVAAWRKAGIIPVFANANSGPKCGSVLSPGDYPNVIGVGATTSTDALAGFSSRGPTSKGLLKPDVSAPGQGVRSEVTPVMLRIQPGITYEEIYKVLTITAETSTLTPNNQTCGGVDDSKYPNNNYGYGRINVFKAAGSAPSPTPAPTSTKPSC